VDGADTVVQKIRQRSIGTGQSVCRAPFAQFTRHRRMGGMSVSVMSAQPGGSKPPMTLIPPGNVGNPYTQSTAAAETFAMAF